jgi:hypothetical protein
MTLEKTGTPRVILLFRVLAPIRLVVGGQRHTNVNLFESAQQFDRWRTSQRSGLG